MREILVSVAFVLLSACAVSDQKASEGSEMEMPFVYGDFGFKPEKWAGGALTSRQNAELEQCKSIAKPRLNDSNLSAIYGLEDGQADFFGATLTGCLSDEKDGKGWSVSKRTESGWEVVTSREAARFFLGALK